jgi:hypothetical protein
MRCFYYPQSLVRICGANREIGSWFLRVDPRVLFFPSCPGYTSRASALDRSNWCELFLGFASGELLNPCVFGLCCCWSVLGRFGGVFVRLCVGFFLLAGCVLEVSLFQGLKKSLRLSGMFVMRLL